LQQKRDLPRRFISCVLSGDGDVFNKRAFQIGLFLSLFAGALLLATQSFAGATNEQNTDRPGSDYTSYDLPNADPALCRKACDDDAKCIAYTYVKPGVQGPAARCYLKDPAPAAQANGCCVSGVKAAQPVSRTVLPQFPRDNTVMSPEARVEDASQKREFPAEFLYAIADSADLEAEFRGRFRSYGIAFDWSEVGPKTLRFRWLNKSQGVASARWEVSTAPFAPLQAGAAITATTKPSSDAKSMTTAPSAIPPMTRGQAQARAAMAPDPTVLATGAAPITQLRRSRDGSDPTVWSFFEIDLGKFEPFVLKGLNVDPLKTGNTIGGPNANDLRPNLYVRVVLLGADGKPLGGESNMINIQFRRIVVGTLKKPKFSPSVAGVEKTIPWRAFAWNYQCYAVYSRDYFVSNPTAGGKATLIAKRGNEVDLCKKHDSTWYEDIGNAFLDAFSSLFEFVESSVNWVAAQYSKVKSIAFGTVVAALKGVTGCGDICQSVVSTAFDTGLAMAGIPPSLPDFDKLVADLEEGGIESLTAVMTEAAAAQGLPLTDLAKGEIKTQLTKMKDELKSEISRKQVGGSLPLQANLNKQYHPMTVVFHMRNNGSLKSEDTSVCISQTDTPDPQRSMGYFPACAIVPALIPGGSIPVSIDIDAFEDPKAWEILMPTSADYVNIIVNGAGPINAKINAAKAARDAWTNKYVHSSHSFGVSIGKDPVGSLNCSKGGETCVFTP
jgi:hypothetical protein